MKIINIIFILLLTASCTHSNNDKVLGEIELTKSNAIELHDSLMADMGKLNLIKKRLKSRLENSDSVIEKIENAILKVDKADKAMWDWMHNFDVAYSHQDDSITLHYYRAKLSDIKEVKEKFDSAFYKSNKLLE